MKNLFEIAAPLINQSMMLCNCTVSFNKEVLEKAIGSNTVSIESDAVLKMVNNEWVGIYSLSMPGWSLMVKKTNDKQEYFLAFEVGFVDTQKMLGNHGKEFLLNNEFGYLPQFTSCQNPKLFHCDDYVRANDTVPATLLSATQQIETEVGLNFIEGEDGNDLLFLMNRAGDFKAYFTHRISGNDFNLSESDEKKALFG